MKTFWAWSLPQTPTCTKEYAKTKEPGGARSLVGSLEGLGFSWDGAVEHRRQGAAFEQKHICIFMRCDELLTPVLAGHAFRSAAHKVNYLPVTHGAYTTCQVAKWLSGRRLYSISEPRCVSCLNRHVFHWLGQWWGFSRCLSFPLLTSGRWFGLRLQKNSNQLQGGQMTDTQATHYITMC